MFAQLPQQLNTERLELRLVTVEWLDEIFAENKGSVEKYFLKFDVKEELQTWINENRRQFERGEKMEMVVLNTDTKEFLGMVCLHRLNIAPEFGIWIKESAQGHGYGKEAVKGLMDWYKLTFGVAEKIRYLVETGNFASINLARSLKMEAQEPVQNEEGLIFQQFTV